MLTESSSLEQYTFCIMVLTRHCEKFGAVVAYSCFEEVVTHWSVDWQEKTKESNLICDFFMPPPLRTLDACRFALVQPKSRRDRGIIIKKLNNCQPAHLNILMLQSPRSHFVLTTHLYVHTFYVSICVLDSHICRWVMFNYIKSAMWPKVNFVVGCSSSVCRLLQDYHSFLSCPDRRALCCSYIYHPTLFPFLLFAGCYKITTVFSHAQTVVLCVGCSTVLCQPTGGKARLTEGQWQQAPTKLS